MGSLRTRIPQGCDFVKRLRQYALDLILKGLAQNGIVGCAFQCSRVGIQRILAVSTFEADFPSSMFLLSWHGKCPPKNEKVPKPGDRCSRAQKQHPTTAYYPSI